QRRAGVGLERTQLPGNHGRATNQHMPPAHLHLIPRQRGDGLGFAGRLLLHFTGIFWRRAKLEVLQQQSASIAEQVRVPWVS
ncbi:HIT family protein, partial [Pseudomonas sp. MWU12-2534b]